MNPIRPCDFPSLRRPSPCAQCHVAARLRLRPRSSLPWDDSCVRWVPRAGCSASGGVANGAVLGVVAIKLHVATGASVVPSTAGARQSSDRASPTTPAWGVERPDRSAHTTGRRALHRIEGVGPSSWLKGGDQLSALSDQLSRRPFGDCHPAREWLGLNRQDPPCPDVPVGRLPRTDLPASAG